MSKKYDNNLQEIKDNIPIKTFATNSVETEEDKENGIYELTTTFLTQFYDAREKCLIDNLLRDMEENKEKYKGLTIIPVEREKIVELLNKGKEFDQLKQQFAQKDKEISKLKEKASLSHFAKISNDTRIENLKTEIKDQRHQICEKIREKIYQLGSDAIEISEYMNVMLILDQIEKGE